MKRTSRRTRSSSQGIKKAPKGRVPAPHDTRTMIEEAIVWLHAIAHYSEDLTQPELDFLGTVKKNLARMHRRREP